MIKGTSEREWMVIPPSYNDPYDNDGDGYDDSLLVQLDADTEHYDEVFTVHARGQMYDRYDDTPLTSWVQVDWEISAPGGVNQLEWSPEMHFHVPNGYTSKEGLPYIRTKTLIYLYDDEWHLEQNGDYEYGPWEIRKNLYPPASNDPPVLSNGYVDPPSGNTSTLFYYYVHYYDPEGVAPQNLKQLCIDGDQWHTMGLYSGSASNGVYRCVLTLSVGTHNFYFKFSDGVNTVYDPLSGTHPGPTVSDNVPPVLSNGYVTPNNGNTSTLFYYYVMYYDADGDSPSQRQVCIDESQWHTMGLYSGSASDGVYRCVLTLSSGSHNYYFKFSDGVNSPVQLPSSGTYSGPTVDDPPVLSNGYVDPPSGNTSTLFYYYVHYYDPESIAPTQKQLCIDGSEWHTMGLHNGTPSNGYYKCVLTLPEGTHNYFFKFSDGVNTVTLPSIGGYPGPTVIPSGQVELYYDDGTAEGGLATSTLPHYKAVRFHTPTAGTYQLTYAKYYIYTNPSSFELQIRDESAQIIYSGTVTPTEVGWFIVDLTSEEIYVQGDFYIAIKYLTVGQPELGYDTSDPDLESGEGTGFPAPPNLSSLDWMIRAVLGENQPPIAYIDDIHPNPAIEGETIYFTGHGSDTDGSIVEYRWESSIDGFLSSSSSFSTSSLSVGNHTIYLYVKDNLDVWSSPDTENLTIRQPLLFLSSRTDDGLVDIGTIIFKGITEPDEVYELPTTVTKAPAWYMVWASLNDSGYDDSYNFLEWETSGGVWVDQPNSPQTSIEITGDGQLTAVWELKQLSIQKHAPVGCKYRLGDHVTFSVDVADQYGNPAENCVVWVIITPPTTPSQPQLPLSYFGDGEYIGYYKIPTDAETGYYSAAISVSLPRTSQSTVDYFDVDPSAPLSPPNRWLGSVKQSGSEYFKYYVPYVETTFDTQLSVFLGSLQSDSLYLKVHSPSDKTYSEISIENPKRLTIVKPEIGIWTIEVFGADVSEDGAFFCGVMYEYKHESIFSSVEDLLWAGGFIAQDVLIDKILKTIGFTGTQAFVIGIVVDVVLIAWEHKDTLGQYAIDYPDLLMTSSTTDGQLSVGHIAVSFMIDEEKRQYLFELSQEDAMVTIVPWGQVSIEAIPPVGYEFDHWEVVQGSVTIENIHSDKTDMFLYDPLNSPDNTVRAVFRLAESSVQVSALSPMYIMVTNPHGLRIGFDSETMSLVNEIPSATYSGPGTDPQIIFIPNPVNGSYLIEAFGTGAGSFIMNMQSIVNGSIVDSETWEGTVVPDQQCIQAIDLSVDGEITSVYDVWTVSFAGTYPIADFAIYNGALYAASDNNFYVYDGNWTTIQAPTFTLSLVHYEGKLYIGGKGGLYSFNGTDFTLILNTSGYIRVLGIYNDTLYAGTVLDNPPTLYYCNGSADNPDNWHMDTAFSTILNFSGPFGSLNSFAVYNNNMYVTSGGTIYSYNGTDWSIVTTYVDVSAFLDMKVYNGKLYIATRDQAWRKPVYQGYSGFSGRVIEFDGINWTTVFDHDYWIYSLETYNDKLYVGTANKIYTYNGTHWETSFNSEEGAYYAISFITFGNSIYAGMGNGYIFVDPSHETMQSETIMVPEFPSFIILPLFMILSTMVVVVFAKKKVLRKPRI